MNQQALGSILVSFVVGSFAGFGLANLTSSDSGKPPGVPAHAAPVILERVRDFLPDNSIELDVMSTDDGESVTYAVTARFADSRRPPIELALDLEAAMTNGLGQILGRETSDLDEIGARITVIYRETSADEPIVTAWLNIAKEGDGAEESLYSISLIIRID